MVVVVFLGITKPEDFALSPWSLMAGEDVCCILTFGELFRVDMEEFV